MDDESDSDAVIITMNKSSEKTTSAPSENAAPVESTPVEEKKEKEAAPAPTSKPSTISFASVASAIKEISNSTSTANGNGNGSIESTPVALKA